MENLSILNSPFASCMKWFFSRLAVACTAKKNTHSKCTMCLCLIDWIEILHSMNCTERNIAKRYKLPSQLRSRCNGATRPYLILFLCRYNTCRLKLWASLAEKSCYCVVAIVTLGKRSKQKAKFISATTRYSFYFVLVLLSGGATSQANDE